MENPIGKGLAAFEAAVDHLDHLLEPYPALRDHVFQGTQEWRDLLVYKLVPHMQGRGCLVAAVTGGTNTGKSTIFNLLVGTAASPMVNTAAATCHPVLAGNRRRVEESLASKLVPEFAPYTLDRPEQATDPGLPHEALFVVEAADLPDHVVVMDTPDVDSIERQNWEVADHLRAAGDVMIAVVTAEKYKDERVVEFFRHAVGTSRVVIPVMNKANPAEDFAVARRQLGEFRSDVGTDAPRFVVAHDFGIAKDLGRPIQSLDGAPDLRAYLEGLDVTSIKEKVYEGTIGRFAGMADEFVAHAETTRGALDSVLDAFSGLAEVASHGYTPAPGKEVGGLFHAFVQSKRGPVRKTIGATSAAVVRGTSAVSKAIRTAFLRRATLDAPKENEKANEKLRELHRESLIQITRDLVTECIEKARRTAAPARALIGERFNELDVDAVAERVAGDVLQADEVSDAFEQHATKMLETWWNDHKGRRHALEALDAVLAVMPAAIAAPIALHTGGVGAAEAVVFAGPVAAQFVTRVMEYQFGDALFDFLSPWNEEQQELCREALMRHVVLAALAPLREAAATMNDEMLNEMRGALEACRTV